VPSLRALAGLGLVFAACQSAVPNRDAHGPEDVAGYIAELESDGRLEELRTGLVVERLDLAPGAWVADLGSGPGVFTLEFARACPDGAVLAVDIEPRQLDRLRERVRREQLDNVVPVLASETTPHLPPASVDLIFIGDTYHHLSERVAYMRNLRRALRPRGRLAVFEYKSGELPYGPPPERKLPEGVRESELRQAGWRLETRFDTHEWHSFEIWVPAR
jgi:SAM-dependent methyltransferase